MDRRIRHVAAALTALLVAIALRAGAVQALRPPEGSICHPDDPAACARNPWRVYAGCIWKRGDILSADGQVLAESVQTASGGRCRYQRRYPTGDLVAHVVGYWSLYFGATGLERAYDTDLVGEEVPPQGFFDLFSRRQHIGNTLVSTIDTRLQRVALEALGGRRGGVVALNPKTGAVLVAASVPSFDPNPLASNDEAAAAAAFCALGSGPGCHNPRSPLVSVALQARRPPGSSFKVVTAAAALESGRYTPKTFVKPLTSFTPPNDNRAIHNFGGGSCGGTLQHSLQVSCNTAFAQVAVGIGADQLYTTAQAMGLGQSPGPGSDAQGCDARAVSELRETFTGCVPKAFVARSGYARPFTEPLSRPGFLARAGFGQWRLQVSPFGMALVAATVANGGVLPRPRFADRVIDPAGRVVREIRTSVGPAALSKESARQLKTMMQAVVTGGTGAFAFRGFRIPVAGKTGTAQQPSCAGDEAAIFGPDCGRLPHAWFVAFAPADDPVIAVAVLVERGGGNNEEATGGRVAAPVARRVLEAYFQLYPVVPGPQERP